MKETKILCDKCGEKVGINYREVKFIKVSPPMSVTGCETEEVRIDLCETCMNDFEKKITTFLRK